MPGPTRRSLLLGSAAAAFLAACGGNDTDDAAGDDTSDDTSNRAANGAEAAFVLGLAFDRNNLLVAGIPQRAPFLLLESTGGLVPPEDAPAELTFEIQPEDGDPLEPVTVARHGDDVDRTYYPLQTTFPSPGLHTLRTEVAGTALESTVMVNDRANVAVPQVGDPLPTPPTPTTADPLGVSVLCTAEPPCPLHDVSLAATGGRPVAALWATPAYCQVAICGPVVDVLVEAAPEHPDFAVVHLEVYPNEPPPEGRPPEAFDAFGLTYEPVLFVADASGTITARLDNIYDRSELDAALATAT